MSKPVNAYQFLLCGGSIGITEWTAMSDEQHAALVEAAEQLERERALMIALSIHNPSGMALDVVDDDTKTHIRKEQDNAALEQAAFAAARSKELEQ